MTVQIGRGTTIAAFLRSLLAVVVVATTASAQPGPPLGGARWLAPGEPAVRPSLPARSDFDLDNNRIDDRLDRSIGALRRELARERVAARREELAARLAADVEIEIVFSEQVTQSQIDAFAALGGRIDHVFHNVSFGWTGTLSAASLDALPAVLGPSLLVVAGDTPARLHMDEATRGGRVRPVWASGFAGQPSGISGTTNITVGIVDSGVDDSHTDLAGRMAFWADYTTDAAANPVDIVSHGSHVAGIAVGTGAAFGVGPGTLKFTDSGNLGSVAASQFFLNGIHFPAQFMTAQMNAAWLGGGDTLLRIAARTNGVGGGFISICNSPTTSSPIALTCQTNGNTTQMYSTALPQSSNASIDQFATTVSLSPYQAVGDGFNAMRGVAPGARWAGAKAFTNAGAGGSLTIGAAVDGLVAQRTTHNVKVMNLSLGLNGAPGVDTALRAKVNTAVNNGIVVVASAGNDGPGSAGANVVDDPGRAALALTVGATNDANALTRYSSAGFASPGSDEDNKPDLVAPGGSDFYSKILSVDSNDSDADSSAMADRQANDYASKKGTSMAAPFAAGSAALVIDAMQKAGATWNFNSGTQPLFVKMLLCASSTETNAVRENAAGSNPTLGRSTTPKDIYEGYGLLNADAAVEAITTVYSGGSLGGSTDGGAFDRRAWGRKLGITSGGSTQLTLTVPDGADYDLYLYSGNPDAKGNPVIVASSTNAGAGTDEVLAFTPTSTETRYLFVKRVSGSGDWSLTSGVAQSFCGDGQKTGDEQCDDGNQVGGDCCSASCQYEANNSTCNDGLFCTSTDRCNTTGVCVGSGNPCSTGPECNNTCSEANDNCFAAAGTPCTADSSVCTLDQCNGSGSCAHPAGNGGTVCRTANGVCDVPESCNGTSASCPGDGYAGTTVTCRASSGVCDPAELCQGTGPACPANTFLSNTTTCRASGGVCDSAELCTGTSGACPANTFSSNTTPCRAAAGVCDAVETCTGTSAACPGDAFVPSSTTCRAANGICDAAENCTGASASCPGDAFAATTKTCRIAAGICDTAEKCSGTDNACPSDEFASRTTVCRAAASICDLEETCSGGGTSCPADAFATSGTTCREASGACDAEERCTGASGACPANTFEPTTTVCRISGGVCDPEERCTGTAATCPGNSFSPSTTTCRTAGGVCDSAERCTGASATCPTDTLADADTVCRPAAGGCDAAEFCTGLLPLCPVDLYKLIATPCRASAGVCDTVEVCSGLSAACPADEFASGNTCRSSAGVCDPAETCNGASANCPANAFSASTVPCRGSSSVCDAAELCTGNGAACPADSFSPSTTLCRAASGACDATEFCTGASGACPGDAFAATTKVCRAAVGVCDSEETCSGTSNACPANGFASSATVCRAAASICDVAETCSGAGASCPADDVADAGAVCRPASGVCDVAESCTGASGACPADSFATTATTCRGSAGVCDAAERCTGTSTSCPGDVFASSSTPCRAANGVCDAAETCTGTSNACAADAVASDSVVCRAGAGECDVAETCDGSSKACPANEFVSADTACASDGLPCTKDVCSGTSAACTHPAGNAGAVCRAAAGVCDTQESCNGTSTACPANTFASSATSCRAASGVCDLAEACSGTSASCPGDAVATAAVTCRASAGVCDVAETCSGAKTCPSDSLAPDNTSCTTDDNVCTNDVCNGSSTACQHEPNSAPCNDGVFCNGVDTCAATTCSQHAGNPCAGADGDADCTESCNEDADQCSAPDPNGSACNDGVACTTGETCQAGECVEEANTCGECGDGHTDDGEECDDGNLQNGDCCSASCKISGGNGACDDGVFCNGPDRCSNGACNEHDGDPCAGADGDGDCSESCDEAADDCSAPDANGSVCNDASFCNGADTCNGGACSNHSGDPCPGADGDGNCAESCSEPGDACTASDFAGSNCDDGDPCTVDDQCSAGTCSGEPSDAPECTTTTTVEAVMCGDASGDGRLSAGDAQIALRTAVGTANCELESCDYSGDGRVTATDANFILRVAVGQDVEPKCPSAAAALAASTTSTTLE